MIKRLFAGILITALLLSGCSKPDVRGTFEDIFGGKEEAAEEISTEPEELPEIVLNLPEPEPVPEEIEEEPEEEPDNLFEGYLLSEEDVSENGVFCKSVAEPEKVRIVFAGDINFDKHYANMNAMAQRGGTIDSVLSEDLIALLNDADICMINNEFPYSSRGTPTPGKTYTFRADPETVNYLHDMGADIVSLANNHAYDHGPDAMLDTLDILEEAQIPYVGAGRNIEEASKPVYFIAGGMKIAFVSATQIERSQPPDTKEATETEPGVLRTLDPARFLEVIRKAEEQADFVIVYVHWGSEGTNQYEASQRDLAAAYAEAGADLIIGDHPHVLQGFDYAGNVPVMYSLGNFWFNSKTIDTCAVEAVLSGKELVSLRFLPCLQKGCFTRLFEEGDSEFTRILEAERSYSTSAVQIDDAGYVTHAE